ncbi:hypothetical protein [Pseudomonas syringae]|nr:hypothetical protein [Pseudomonas syringae]
MSSLTCVENVFSFDWFRLNGHRTLLVVTKGEEEVRTSELQL